MPWNIQVSSNATITSDTPITDTFKIVSFADYTRDGKMNLDDLPPFQEQYSKSILAWVEQMRECVAQKPNLYRIAEDGTQIPVTINKVTGKIFLNANKTPVCLL
ncbi:hypothetical protein [Neosynechococcus sphagnicola]|uniref:hypothetical protein n=1 Tax=Neosynechococcus sphagnicola TaxID=1501145 RepID=UPI0012E00B14|nr:hypothetical protein [Neosynechococcus sphagnicola]